MAVSVSVIALTLCFSLSSWVPAVVWYVDKRTTTVLFVLTKLYNVYLELYTPSRKLRQHALKQTDVLKESVRQARLDQRRDKRMQDEQNGRDKANREKRTVNGLSRVGGQIEPDPVRTGGSPATEDMTPMFRSLMPTNKSVQQPSIEDMV